jgi:hypothetical protein
MVPLVRFQLDNVSGIALSLPIEYAPDANSEIVLGICILCKGKFSIPVFFFATLASAEQISMPILRPARLHPATKGEVNCTHDDRNVCLAPIARFSATKLQNCAELAINPLRFTGGEFTVMPSPNESLTLLPEPSSKSHNATRFYVKRTRCAPLVLAKTKFRQMQQM